MSIKTVEINITGIVQGVGFRPFLFNLARNFRLKGYILNRGNAGVRLILQGDNPDIKKFLDNVDKKRPPISFIEKIDVRELDITVDSIPHYSELQIRKSEEGRGKGLTLPPDIAICDNCLKEMRNQSLKHYYLYPFIACAVCGPRYTTVKELPYDREKTTMENFPFCESCLQEYNDFDNRRFHAQTFACSNCGPNYDLYDKARNLIEKDNIMEILEETAKRINEGQIAAIKGIGGIHLVCLADNKDIVLKLRERKGKRKYKPFALMVPNLNIVKDYFKISKKEREHLTSFRRPIVLLEKTEEFNQSNISGMIAPGLNNIGVMLPYSGIHHLLFDYIGEKPLVYTSGNKSSIPMGIENDEIFDQLDQLADFFLLHNRIIHQRSDDSVLRVHDTTTKIIRRSRGYVPKYLPLPFAVKVQGAIATGPGLVTTGAILRHDRIFPTQHIGNVTHLETYDFLKSALQHMQNLLQIKNSEIKFISCDAHPAFITTKHAKELASQLEIPRYPIQHHFAHILGLMAENKIQVDEKVVGMSLDGVGYGDDGNVWGGEIMVCTYKDYQRLGHLEYQPMIGGDRCTKYPARMAASIIINALEYEKSIEIFQKINLQNDLEYNETELNTLISQFQKANNQFPSENIPLTSSTGRILDTISYLVGACKIKTYRGEPAMRLEGLAAKGTHSNINLECKYELINRKYIIKTSEFILDIISLLSDSKNKKEDIAAKAQIELGKVFADVAINIAKKNDIKKIGLSGGVAYNYSISNIIKEKILEAGLIFLENSVIPPGDAGISVGQLIGGLFKHQLT